MSKKRDFIVKLKTPGYDELVFKGKDCEVKEKSILSKLGIEDPMKETIECESMRFYDSEESKMDILKKKETKR